LTQAAITSQQASTSSPQGFQHGQSVGCYELIEPLGRGGMGQVWLARDTKLGRRVALKFLLDRNPDYRARFLQEARTTAHCHHEHIVVIHDVAEFERMPYLVLEYLEGQTLADLAKHGPMPAAQAVDIMTPVLRALAFAHAQGIVHRDLKPSNIFVTRAGNVKVLDFGIAKPLETSQKVPRSAGTQPGVMMGTLRYMAPEQLAAGSPVDHRADIWAAGLILFELLAGRHPLQPLGLAGVERVQDPEQRMPSAASIADVPADILALIDRALEKNPDRRFESAEAVLAALTPRSKRLTPTQREECPYPGLRAFEAADAERFSGRLADVRRARAFLQEKVLVAVVGPSGVGKSSFVQAGLGPALTRAGKHWEILSTRPGRRPIASLIELVQSQLATDFGSETDAFVERRLRAEPGFLAALLRGRARQKNRQILLFVDQFEEIYTQNVSPDDQALYIACILAVADDVSSPLRVALALRSDFLDRTSKHADLSEKVTAGLMLLPELDREGLREAMLSPVEKIGFRFESNELIELLLGDLAQSANPLPLLQFTAARLWDLRDRAKKTLTLAGYQQIGGVAGALVTHADAVLADVDDQGRKTLRGLLQRLVTSERTRAIAEYRDLIESSGAPERARLLLDRLVEARLLVMETTAEGDATVELAHESLVSNWPLLNRWLDEQADAVKFVNQLQIAARQWQDRGRPAGLLWRDDALADARRFSERDPERGLAQRERDFLDAAFRLAKRERRVRALLLVTGFAITLAVAIGALVSMVTIQAAESEARIQAEAAQKKAEQALAAQKRASQAKTLAARNAELADQEKLQRLQVEQREADALKKHIAEMEVALEEARTLRRAAEEANAKLKREIEQKLRALKRQEDQISPGLE
jgi:hypothetical protein